MIPSEDGYVDKLLHRTSGSWAMVVGNGLTLDFRSCYSQLLADWNPGRPLDWMDRLEPLAGIRCEVALPRFWAAVGKELARDPAAHHFEVIDSIAGAAADGSHDARWEATVEMRHYLALAYSAFQTVADQAPMRDWRWTRFLMTSRDRFRFFVSFNYDLVLERALAGARVTHRRFVPSETSGRPLLKPHGSIDFEYSRQAIMADAGYPLNIWTEANDVPPQVLGPTGLLTPRIGPELVPPNQVSMVRRFQWVAPGFEGFRDVGSELRVVFFVGLSYWKVDRPEIDELLSALSPGTVIVSVNPAPAPEFVRAVEERGLEHLQWTGPN